MFEGFSSRVGGADAWGWERLQPQQWGHLGGDLLAAPSPPDTEAYLEKWSPQSALDHLQAKIDAAEAESEVSQARPLCCRAFLTWALDSSPCPPGMPGPGKEARGSSAIWAPSMVPWLCWLDAVPLPVSQAQIEQFLAQDLPLDSFLESFCQSRTRSHVCRTQLEKLQELLQKGQVGRVPAGHPDALASPAPARLAPLQSGVAPKAFDLSYGFVPAFLIPSEAAVPFAIPAAPPRHHLPALGHQPASPCSEIPSPGSPLHLIGHIPLLSPQPFRRQQRPQHQKQEPPHR